MSFDINEFIQNISAYGTSLSSKFDVQFSLPNFLNSTQINGVNQNSQFLTGMPQILQFRAQNVQLPSVGFISNESQRYGLGPSVKQPYNAVFGDIPMTFLCDRWGLIYQFFYRWMNNTYNFSENDLNQSPSTTAFISTITQPTYVSNFEDNIISNVVNITQYDHAGKPLVIINLYRVKPILMAGTPLAWEQTDNFVKLTVNFNFREWSATFPHNTANNGATS